MRVFISYSHDDRKEAESLNAALKAAGFDTFWDSDRLPIGQEFNARISRAIDSADLFVFLASDSSVRPGSYALTELSFAESRWPNPSGFVLPVLLKGFDTGKLPAYIKPITGPVADDNLEARVVRWVDQRARGQDPDGPDDHSPDARLKRWSRLAQPPVGGTRRAFIGRSFMGVIVGAGFVGIGGAGSVVSSGMPGPSQAFSAVGIVFALIGVGVILYSIRLFILGLIGAREARPVIVIDRVTGENSLTITVLTREDERLSLTPLKKGARNAHTGDLGWAWIRGRLLIDFVSG